MPVAQKNTSQFLVPFFENSINCLDLRSDFSGCKCVHCILVPKKEVLISPRSSVGRAADL
jgi:hypothetical protein